MTKTIMLVHGAWLNAVSWEPWKARYEAKGYKVVAPNWPFDDRPPAELRADPHPELAKVGVEGIVGHLAAEIKDLGEEPILIGHSAGGVFIQMLMDRGHGACGVIIDPAPTPGVPLGPHAIVSAFPVLSSWGSWKRAMHMSKTFFKTRFAQTLPEGLKDEHYERYIVPTAGKVYWDGIVKPSPLNFANPKRKPLLVIGGEKDLIADASMSKAIYHHQKKAGSLTELKIFPGRSHWLCLEPGWEEVADYAIDWVERNGGA